MSELTKEEARICIISLKSRVNRLKSRQRQVSLEMKPKVLLDIKRTIATHDKMLRLYPGCFVKNDVHPYVPTSYQQALCDHAEEMSNYILDPNS